MASHEETSDSQDFLVIETDLKRQNGAHVETEDVCGTKSAGLEVLPESKDEALHWLTQNSIDTLPNISSAVEVVDLTRATDVTYLNAGEQQPAATAELLDDTDQKLLDIFTLISDPIRLGKRLRKIREDAGINQNEIADRLAVKPPTINRLEHGKGNPTWKTISAYLAAVKGAKVPSTARAKNVEKLDIG